MGRCHRFPTSITCFPILTDFSDLFLFRFKFWLLTLPVVLNADATPIKFRDNLLLLKKNLGYFCVRLVNISVLLVKISVLSQNLYICSQI